MRKGGKNSCGSGEILLRRQTNMRVVFIEGFSSGEKREREKKQKEVDQVEPCLKTNQ